MSLKEFIKENAVQILAGIGLGGLAVSTALTISGTVKAVRKIDKTDICKNKPLIQKIRIIAPCYIPAALAVTATAYTIVSGALIADRDKRELTTACATLAGSLISAKDTLNKNLTPEQLESARTDILKSKPHPTHIDDDCQLFWFEYLEEYVEATYADFYNAKCELNKKFALNGYATLLDFFNSLWASDDIPESTKRILKAISWTWEDGAEGDYGFIDIGTTKMELDDGMEVIYVTFTTTPSADPEDREWLNNRIGENSEIAYRDMIE